MLLSTFCSGVLHGAMHVCSHIHCTCASQGRWKGFFWELAINLIRAKYSDNPYQGLRDYFIPGYYPKLGMFYTF